MSNSERDVQTEDLSEQTDHLEQEARMVLPGLQALFGFQLVAAFQPPFWSQFSRLEHFLHWFALGMIAVATMLFLLPAAYHRQVERDRVSREFLRVSNRALSWGLYPLMFTICLDFYLVGRAITRDPWISGGFAGALLGLFVYTWIIFPHLRRRRTRERPEQKGPSFSKAS